MVPRVVVIGGGISGHLVQMRIPTARILDWRAPAKGERDTTRSFGANYLWVPLPGVPYRSFTVRTTVDGAIPTIRAVARYKVKIGRVGAAVLGPQFHAVTTGYEPQFLAPPHIDYGYRVIGVDVRRRILHIEGQDDVPYDYLVSTIPLYALCGLVGYEIGGWQYRPIYIRILENPPDMPALRDEWAVNYISDPEVSAYRVTDRDGARHYESLDPGGAIPAKKITPGKIYAHPRVRDIVTSLEADGIFCFGRFARWVPSELVHQTDEQIRDWKERYGL